MTTPRIPKVYDWSLLEARFKDAIGGLPNYKRRDAYLYVEALRERIQSLDENITELSEILATTRDDPREWCRCGHERAEHSLHPLVQRTDRPQRCLHITGDEYCGCDQFVEEK